MSYGPTEKDSFRLAGIYDDDYDVLADGLVVGRIFKVSAAPAGMPWM
jgi:hypothetical protein